VRLSRVKRHERLDSQRIELFEDSLMGLSVELGKRLVGLEPAINKARFFFAQGTSL
jgi:hypothetical protein